MYGTLPKNDTPCPHRRCKIPNTPLDRRLVALSITGLTDSGGHLSPERLCSAIASYLRPMEQRQPYIDRVNTLTQKITLLTKRKRRFGLGRLVSFLGAIILFFVLLIPHHLAAVSAAIICLLIFLILALKDLDNTRALQYQQQLLEINTQELDALDGHIEAFEDGRAFLPSYHDYANDLDIFGPHSLYRFVNRTTAAPSRKLLAERLLHPVETSHLVPIQEAVRELQQELDWRQELRARGHLSRVTEEAYRQITEWSGDSGDAAPKNTFLRWLTLVLPLLTIAVIILAWSGVISWKILWLCFGAHLLAVWRIEKATGFLYQGFSEAIKVMEGFNGTLRIMTEKPFASPLLQQIQQGCFQNGQPATTTLTRLKRILGRLDLKLNPLVHFPLNLALFWDWHQYRQLAHWKQKHPGSLLKWLDAFAEMEVLASFANIAFNYPDWAFAALSEGEEFVFQAEALGHPLLAAEKRVCNDLNLEGSGRILLITGSNMAGKSTFLRTVGVNMILALAGGPACARRIRLSPVQVISSMRIADNLEENISTFYAELKKLEIILKKVRAHEKVFLLLDEILRGTNSQDRHAGARALIRSFIQEQAVGIVATHDLALSEMEGELDGKLVNCHFDVQVHEEELYFDYRLKPGICTSMNASLLMRKIGIDV